MSNGQNNGFFLNVLLLTGSIFLIAGCAGSLFPVAGCVNALKNNIKYSNNRPSPEVIAQIGNEQITEEQLRNANPEGFADLDRQERELARKRFETQKLTLESLVQKKVLKEEAQKQNVTEEALIQKIVKGIKVTDKEYAKFVDEQKIPESQITPQIKERIFAYILGSRQEQAIKEFAAKGYNALQKIAYFVKPKTAIEVDIGNAPLFGAPKALVKIVEFSDFECPYCSVAAKTVQELRKNKKYTGKIQFAFKHFPLPNHPHANLAAQAAACVQAQSDQKFWAYHDLLFENQKSLEQADLEKYAKTVGANLKDFTECLKDKKYDSVVKNDVQQAQKLGVGGTPYFFINGEILNGAPSLEVFTARIDEALQDAQEELAKQ